MSGGVKLTSEELLEQLKNEPDQLKQDQLIDAQLDMQNFADEADREFAKQNIKQTLEHELNNQADIDITTGAASEPEAATGAAPDSPEKADIAAAPGGTPDPSQTGVINMSDEGQAEDLALNGDVPTEALIDRKEELDAEMAHKRELKNLESQVVDDVDADVLVDVASDGQVGEDVAAGVEKADQDLEGVAPEPENDAQEEFDPEKPNKLDDPQLEGQKPELDNDHDDTPTPAPGATADVAEEPQAADSGSTGATSEASASTDSAPSPTEAEAYQSNKDTFNFDANVANSSTTGTSNDSAEPVTPPSSGGTPEPGEVGNGAGSSTEPKAEPSGTPFQMDPTPKPPTGGTGSAG
jgi:hypothetical protein